MNQFWQISGIILWVLLIGYILLRVIYGKNWQLKAGANFFLGSGLMGAAKKLTEEANQADIKKETLTELAVHVFWRLTKVGIFAIIIAMIPFILLFQQNKLITKQNSKIDVQNNLIEAERRSSLVFLMSNVLDKMDDEIKEQRTEKDKKGIHRDSMKFRLSNSLIARTVALSRAFKPYRMLSGDTLSNETVSPERGQLFISLMESQLDSFTQNSIVKNGSFSNAIIKEINLRNANLRNANLQNANLQKASLQNANLQNASLQNANLQSANLSYATLQSANLRYGNLRYANLSYTNLSYANLRNVDLNTMTLSHANLSYANLRHANLSYANINNADLRHADLRQVDLRHTNLHNANLRYANLRYADFKEVRNLTVAQLLQANSLYRSKNLPPKTEVQLRKEKPCLFTKEGCPTK